MHAYRIRKYIAAIIAVLVSVLLTLWTGVQPLFCAYAAEFTAYDKTTIEDDLRSLNIGNYPKNTGEKHRLLDEAGFMEYGFSQSTFIADNYFGIYFYLYNPCEREISTRAGANVVNIAIEYDTEGNPVKYENCPITYLDCTSNYRFYKFKLTNSADVYARALAYSKDHEGKRRYDIGSIQVWYLGDPNATDSFVGKGDRADRDGISYTYFCTGYAAGCGADGSDQSTLVIDKQELNAISLEVKHTYFRPDKPNGKDYYTHDSLSSVYFAVPKKIVEAYGAMSRIRGEYLKARTNDIFVTGNEKYYKIFQTYVGKSMGCSGGPDKLSFATKEQASGMMGLGDHSSVMFNADDRYEDEVRELTQRGDYRYIDTLHYLFYAENGKADGYNVSGDLLLEYMKDYTEQYATPGSELVAGKYLDDLFDWVDDGKTLFDISDQDMTEPLTEVEISQNWLQSVNGSYSTTTGQIYKSKKAIYAVQHNDFVYTTNGELDTEIISRNLLIDKSDVQDFTDYYNQYSGENVIYLIRFAADEYQSCEAHEFSFSNDFMQSIANLFGGVAMKNSDTNCYWSMEYVYLNFDIIDLTFTNEKGSTVIPVVMSPIDIVGDITHPSYTTDDYPLKLVWWLIGIASGSAVIAILLEITKKGARGK